MCSLRHSIITLGQFFFFSLFIFNKINFCIQQLRSQLAGKDLFSWLPHLSPVIKIMNYQVAGGWGRGGGLIWMERGSVAFVSSAQSLSPSPVATVPPGQEAVPFISPHTQEEVRPSR